ncbi:MAG: hypothetical protein J1F23_03340 [Oscillospiraceae bacterium]|nr:hypothetical protein [Oscillospiraceae bacterium]
MERQIKYPWEIDVAVLCIFFVRDSCFAQSFAAVKKARPRQLLLWQDGPREGRRDDIIGIQKCREIAEDIDWDCEVYKCYNEKNYGCDPSTFLSHKWAFSIVDKCIVLEDDVVPDNSFFYFCKEMLDRYEKDTRINRICGMNQVSGFQCPDSYFFSSIGSVWGWATWKRVADLWDENYNFLEDEYTMTVLSALKNTKSDHDYFQTCLSHKKEGVPHWETVQTYARHLNSQLNIIPAKNLIKNVGLGENSTHSNANIQLVPRKLRNVFYQDSDKLEFPLRHPKYVLENVTYRKELFRITGKDHPWIKKMRMLESLWLRLIHGDIKSITKGIKRVIKKG